MKIILPIQLVVISLLLTSCEIDDSGELHTTGLFWVLVAGFVLAVIAGIIQGESNLKKRQEGMKKMRIIADHVVFAGKYAGGHPDIDKTLENCNIYLKNGILNICVYDVRQLLSTKAIIPVDSVKNITVEDSSSIDKKVTLGRVLLVGIFALAWRKNKRNEYAFVTIEWNDGKFDHSSIFAFEGKNAMQTANTTRNALIKLVR